MLSENKLTAFVPTSHPEKARTFYRDTLGLKLLSEDQYAMVFDANDTMLRVTPVHELHPHPFTVLGWAVKDVVKEMQALEKKDVVFEHYGLPGQDTSGLWTAPSGAQVVWFKDADGNLLSLSQHNE